MPIVVTTPTLPNFSEYACMLSRLWDTGILTNNGEFCIRLEKELCEYLDVPNVVLCCNGTMSLLISLKSFEFEKDSEIITTPFTFPATVQMIDWCGCIPVFCDITPDTWDIDYTKIEALITSKTKAILPVNPYGFSCNFKEIQKIADRHKLKVIYDAASSFGITDNSGKSVLLNGDAACLSFHATKIFSTIEGGAIITKDDNLAAKLRILRNFGFQDHETILDGINGKLNEVQSIYGLSSLKLVKEEIHRRMLISKFYGEELRGISSIHIRYNGEDYNHSLFPILVEHSRNAIVENAFNNDIVLRKYYYPLCSNFEKYSKLESSSPEKLPVANYISDHVLCIPIHGRLTIQDLDKVVNCLKEIL